MFKLSTYKNNKLFVQIIIYNVIHRQKINATDCMNRLQ